jgi:hypothetical protein
VGGVMITLALPATFLVFSPNFLGMMSLPETRRCC